MPLKNVTKQWPTKAEVKTAIDAAIAKAYQSLIAHPVLSKAKESFRRVMHGTPDDLMIEAIFRKRDREAAHINVEMKDQFWGRTIRSILDDIKNTDTYKKDDEFDKLIKGTGTIGGEAGVLAPDDWYAPADAARKIWNVGNHTREFPPQNNPTILTDWTGVPYKLAVSQMIEVLILLDAKK